MPSTIDSEQVRAWLDDELVSSIDRVPDEAAVFNLAVEISNLIVHVVRRQPDGPLVVGQQIEYGEEIRSRIQSMDEGDRNELVARIRETLTAAPVVYGFHDEQGNNVRFADVHRILVEHRIYPDGTSRQALMDGLIEVWKTMRYLDDLVTLIDSVEAT
ncbi:MAG TPA: DUF2299 family protein [Natrialbaceae archaeon]|nr:DUF2299 family protein [Natrialbaceae archaeon]